MEAFAAMMYELVNLLAIGLSMVFAPALLVASIMYRRQFKGVVLQWKKTGLVFFTIFTFLGSLVLFVGGCFFFASYLGGIDGLKLWSMAEDRMLQLGFDCLLLMVALWVMYAAAQNFGTQFITQDGIYLTRFPLLIQSAQQDLLPWENIKDYYLRSDYPITAFQFIVQQPDGSYARRNLKVPFYVMPRFEVMLEMNLRRQQELREQSRAILRKMSRN